MVTEEFELYLIRHGLAAERGDNFPDDTKRPLTSRGIQRLKREAKALKLLEQERPDAVVLDLNLNGKLPTDLVDALVARQVPFVIVTGYGKRQFDSPALQGAPRLHKPIKTAELVRALSDLVRAAD